MDYLSVTPRTGEEEPQCPYTMQVPGIEGYVCCMLGPGHAGPHAIDEAVVALLVNAVEAGRREES